jgi:hypothetical protein
VRKFCDREIMDIGVVTELHIFRAPEYERVVFGIPLGRIVFKSLSIIRVLSSAVEKHEN